MTSPSDENLPGEGGASVERLSLALDVVGAVALILGAFLVWPPAALFVLGVLALVASWRLSS